MRVLDEAGPLASARLPGLFRAAPEAFLRRSAGRETFRWKLATGESYIVKRMPGRGGCREHENLEALRKDGLPVPRPIAWAQEGSRLLFGGPVRSLVVMEDVEHEETLRDRLARAAPRERERWSAELLEVVVRLHVLGWHHRDLYLQHFLVAGGLVLIDVGRARRDPRARRRWHVKDLAALRHSCPANVGAREQLRFLSRYLDQRGILERTERSAWARAIAAKAAAMARHVPRDERAD
ncbi:MAG: lipopolysaccharide kinase InaA family protein [Planctomycetota bacterium]